MAALEAQQTDPTAGLPPGSTVVWDSGVRAAQPNVPPPPPADPTASARDDFRMPAGVPARGRGTQIDAANAARQIGEGYQTATTPMLDTGHPWVDQFTSPISALLAAGGVGAVLRAGVSGGLGAMLGESWTQALPTIRYEALKSILMAAKVPAAVAGPVAMVVSNYKGKAASPPERWTVPLPQPNAPEATPQRWTVPLPQPTQATPEPTPQRWQVPLPQPTQATPEAAPQRWQVPLPQPTQATPEAAPQRWQVPLPQPNTVRGVMESEASSSAPAASSAPKASKGTTGSPAPVGVSTDQIKDAATRYLVKEVGEREDVAARIVNTAIKNGVRIGNLIDYLKQNY